MAILEISWQSIAAVHRERVIIRHLLEDVIEEMETGLCAHCERPFPCGPAAMARTKLLEQARRG